MTAQIIEFGAIARQPRAAVSVPEENSKRTAADDGASRNADLRAEREARNQTWREAEVRTRFYQAFLDFLDATWIAKTVGIESDDLWKAHAAFPGTFFDENTVRDDIRQALRDAGRTQLLTPAGLSTHLSWKETQLRARMPYWGIDAATERQIVRLINADKMFLDACPRKSGGRAKPRT